MMGAMEQQGVATTRLIELVDGYSRRIYPAVFAQQPGPVACSPLGVWLLLAACAIAADGANRIALEQVIGCSRDDALELLSAFMVAPPSALNAAIAIWVSAGEATDALAAWVRRLPRGIESGYMPTKEEADAWADRNTLGLIKSFPLDINELTRIVLASALATKVSWEIPFAVALSSDHLGAGSPWHGMVERLLWDQHPGRLAMLADTSRAGLVAVHTAVANEELTVMSVSAEPAVPREAALDAAHEVAAFARGADSPASQRSLFDLALGAGHSWSVSERKIPTRLPDERKERITDVYLPAWSVESSLDLQASPAFGSDQALGVIRELVGARPDDELAAAQAAVASFTRYGFEAGAITRFGISAAALARPRETGLERRATLRFDHSYAVVALAGKLDKRDLASGFTGLPVFSAWVATPQEAEDGDRPSE